MVAPDGVVPSGQPFATIITKDYPDEPSAGLDRPGSFRVSVFAGRHAEPGATQVASAADPGTPDLLMPHPAYAELGWMGVVDPGERTRDQVLALLEAAHAAALARWQRRHDTNRSP